MPVPRVGQNIPGEAEGRIWSRAPKCVNDKQGRAGFVLALRKCSFMEREVGHWEGLPRQWWNPILGSVQKPLEVALGDIQI